MPAYGSPSLPLPWEGRREGEGGRGREGGEEGGGREGGREVGGGSEGVIYNSMTVTMCHLRMPVLRST